GHAGLFAGAADVDALATRLRACWRGKDDFVPGEIVREFWKRDPSVAGSTWALGWDTPSPTGSAAGTRMSRTAVGHLGFTGTSLWIDLERDANVVLLTNRVHPRRDNERIREWRPRLHDRARGAPEAGGAWRWGGRGDENPPDRRRRRRHERARRPPPRGRPGGDRLGRAGLSAGEHAARRARHRRRRGLGAGPP